MKKIFVAALGATLMAGFAVGSASAAQRHSQRNTVQTLVRADGGFRNSYNAYDRGEYDGRAFNSRVEGGAISAPAGR